jgi:hypothetical protein
MLGGFGDFFLLVGVTLGSILPLINAFATLVLAVSQRFAANTNSLRLSTPEQNELGVQQSRSVVPRSRRVQRCNSLPANHARRFR